VNLLAIDSAASLLSVAVAAAGQTWYSQAEAGTKHSELVMDSVDALMKKAGIAPRDLEGILCMGGPGSFTGLRIGFSIAKGLSLSLGIPFAAIPTLDCAAMPCSGWPGPVLPVIAARKNAFFYALYQSGKRLGPDMDAESGEIAEVIAGLPDAQKVLLAGPDADKLHAILLDRDAGIPAGKFELASAPEHGYAGVLLEIAEKTNIFDTDTAAWLFAGPEYIRKSDAEMNLKNSLP